MRSWHIVYTYVYHYGLCSCIIVLNMWEIESYKSTNNFYEWCLASMKMSSWHCYLVQGPISLMIFASEMKFNDNWFCSLYSKKTFATKYCTWNDSCVVLAFAKNCCHMIDRKTVSITWNFYQIQILSEIFNEMGPRFSSQVTLSQYLKRTFKESVVGIID